MGQHTAKGDRPVVGVGVLDGHPVQVLRHGIVETQLAGVSLLHDGDAGEQLRDRADAVQRVGLRGTTVRRVRQSEAVRRDQLLVVDDSDRDTRDLVDRGLVLDPLLPGVDGVGDARVVDQRPRLLGRDCSRGKAHDGKDKSGNDGEATHDGSFSRSSFTSPGVNRSATGRSSTPVAGPRRRRSITVQRSGPGLPIVEAARTGCHGYQRGVGLHERGVCVTSGLSGRT